MRQSNVSLAAHFHCQSTSTANAATAPLPSIRGPGYNRETICTVTNLCVDAERGAWIVGSDDSGEFPRINVVAADPGSDSYYRPAVLDRFPETTYRFVDETIFLYGQDPTNGPTWTMNNLLPLHSVMTSYGGSRSSWFMRVSGQESKDNDRKQQSRAINSQNMELETYLLAPLGHEIVLTPHRDRPLASHQIKAPSKALPTCFSKAVIGLQSRCTRSFCENLIGGRDLTGSLRAKALDVLSRSMIRFQKTDPDIVHAPSGEKVPLVSHSNLTIVQGESAPRSRIQVGLLGRYGNTSIPNANALELSLLARGFAVKTIHLDHPSEISLAQAAQLFRNQSILVAPQGDALGYSTWMAPGTVVVSILPRFTQSSRIYTDRMMAFGKRFFAWDCQDESCVQPDRDLAHECIEAIQYSYKYDEGITAQEFEDFVGLKQDFRQRSIAWKAIADCYTKDVSRRLNVAELTGLIEKLAKDFTFEELDDVKGRIAGEKRMHVRRGVTEGDLEKDVEDADEDTDEQEEENENVEDDLNAIEESDGQQEDLDKEGVVRIQGGDDLEFDNNSDIEIDDNADAEADAGVDTDENTEEGPGEDINVHEYDEDKVTSGKDAEKHSIPAELEKDNSLSLPSPTSPPQSLTSRPKQPLEPSQPTTDLKIPPIHPPLALQYQNVQPMYDFAEFCKRGHCCGSAKTIEHDEIADAIGANKKALTPCAASMSTIVFGGKGVWGLNDELASVQESRSLVWQMDLGRS
ncbi:hypothetical protein EDD11_003299 [Mortierella claussenii]|nr:hypothetical protein EDD11_003299 [Mortierella claussenii]